MSLNWLITIAVGFVLEIAVAIALLRGHLRRFPVLFAYCVFLSFSSFTDGLAYFEVGQHARPFAYSYWINDMILHAFVVLIIAGLVNQALGTYPHRTSIRWLLVVLPIVVGVASLYLNQNPSISRWMTPVSRNLSFCEEVLVFMLWGVLLQNRVQDQVLLLVSSGLGIQVTGEVIGHTLRIYARSRDMWLPNVLVNASDLLCLVIWLWAFRAARVVAPEAPPAAHAHHNTI